MLVVPGKKRKVNFEYAVKTGIRSLILQPQIDSQTAVSSHSNPALRKTHLLLARSLVKRVTLLLL
jgi:hypothetical protein